MYIVKDIVDVCEAWAPRSWAEAWDNVGLLFGSSERKCERVCLALDLSLRVVENAIATGAQLILLHHPPLFSPVKTFNEEQYPQNMWAPLWRNGIACYAAHTNLDVAPGGVSAALLTRLGLFPTSEGECGQGLILRTDIIDRALYYGRYAALDTAIDFHELLQSVKTELDTDFCLVSANTPKRCSRIAVSGGSFAEEWIPQIVERKIDCLIVGEIKHHALWMLEDLGVRVIMVGHDCSERVILPTWAELLRRELPGLEADVLYQNSYI